MLLPSQDNAHAPEPSTNEVPDERPVFVSETGRRARVLGLAGRGLAVVTVVWLLALAIGALGFGRLPGIPFPPVGDLSADRNDKAGAPARPRPPAASPSPARGAAATPRPAERGGSPGALRARSGRRVRRARGSAPTRRLASRARRTATPRAPRRAARAPRSNGNGSSQLPRRQNAPPGQSRKPQERKAPAPKSQKTQPETTPAPPSQARGGTPGPPAERGEPPARGQGRLKRAAPLP